MSIALFLNEKGFQSFYTHTVRSPSTRAAASRGRRPADRPLCRGPPGRAVAHTRRERPLAAGRCALQPQPVSHIARQAASRRSRGRGRPPAPWPQQGRGLARLLNLPVRPASHHRERGRWCSWRTAAAAACAATRALLAAIARARRSHQGASCAAARRRAASAKARDVRHA